MSNISTEKAYDYGEYGADQKSLHDRLYKQINKQEGSHVDGTSISLPTGILISRDDNDVYIYFYIKA
jgi:hypothetical protein